MSFFVAIFTLNFYNANEMSEDFKNINIKMEIEHSELNDVDLGEMIATSYEKKNK